MMKPLSFRITSNHLPLCVFLSLLWGVQGTTFTATEPATTTPISFPPPPTNFTAVGQSETSINLQWDKVSNDSSYLLQYNDTKTNITETDNDTVSYNVSDLTSGTAYTFTLYTVFGGITSTGVNLTAYTVPPSLVGVNITERSLTSFTLSWKNVKKDWKYLLDINGNITMNTSDEDVVAYSVSSLKPGTRYNFSVTTTFTQLHSAPFTDYTVTAMDCSSVPWHVTSSSIQGMVKGVFTNATAVYNQNLSVSPQGSNVSFTHLVPGATYEVLLVYKELEQCRQRITIIPTNVHGSCSYLNGGSSIVVFWDEPTGVWTEVEVNVTGRTVKIYEHTKRQTIISALQPAKTYEVSLSLLSGDLRSHEPFIVFCSTDPRGVIAGSVLAVLLFLVLVFLAVFILLKRPDFIRNKTFIRRSKLSQSSKKCKEIPVGMFPDHFSQLSMDENRGFVQEYEDLVPIGTEQTRRAAVLPENKAKNRFNNVLPYDWCRVKLTTSNPNETSDYINASYMPGYNREREYIATQGPLPSTVGDFWRMIWEQRVKGIVMVTNCVELGRTKCERYWPADSKPNLQGQLVITLRSEIQERNWTLREFNLKHKSTSEERMVKHFHFTAWPDHGVPLGTNVLIQFRELVRRHIEKEGDGAPTVVHCSAGVGRTGTLIALDVLLQQLKQKRAVGINAFVHKMRLSRPYMVQTESQYVFLHQCMMDSLEPETEENIYENADMIYVNATALQEFCQQQRHT
ncbi:receptor-type tyrosine-protein phosphatase H isoform X6 [Echeneis naucrates]|uniref:receptor-type tyrosine-protein phosphatase H isoform X6 n=1 Tax=Echeneis naucrates TaxID=173247 RepID=UPI00111405AA|nr:receptor-type tyrosine-protein phosphatase H isoform X6 [Echeneis naucrates]